MSDEQTIDAATRAEDSARTAWQERISEIGRTHGFYKRIGDSHAALLVEEGETLVVSFDETERLVERTRDGLPLGFPAVQTMGWSLLSILTDRKSWFRDPDLFAFFDQLVDEEFFEDFENVVFLGAGPMSGYAACAYSVTCPGARVMALNPAATLDREDAPFEIRYRGARRLDFRDRYGFAPAMLDAAQEAAIMFDPYEPMGAAHAALFRGDNVTRHPMRWAGLGILPILQSGAALAPAMKELSEGTLTRQRFAEIARPARRRFGPYIQALVERAGKKNRPKLALAAAKFGLAATKNAQFKRQANAIEAAIAKAANGEAEAREDAAS